MPRPLSANAIEALLAEATDEAFILLVTFWHGDTIFHCCLNTEDIVSRDTVYKATYFQFNLPELTEEAPSGCQIIVDNVDQAMIDLLRRITTPIKVKIELVLGSQPDVVELTLEDLVMREVNWNVAQITGSLKIEDMLNAGFPGGLYEPRTFQGIF